MKRVYLGNKELTTIATVTNGGGGGGDDTQKWVDYFNGTLTEFTVPEGVTSINPSTFVSCTGLTSLTLPSSIASIGSGDRHGWGGETNPFGTLKTMTVKATTPPTLPDYEIPIPTTISSIYVPKYSANIYKAIDGWNKFADKIQTLPQNETVVTYNDGTTKKFDIKGDLTQTSIENKEAITKVLISDDVTSIGESAFVGCPSLTVVTIPNSVTSIGNSAFYNCSSLTGVIIENSTSKLAYNTDAFGVISSNAKLYVPSNLLADYQADSNWSNAFGGGIYAVENIMKVTYTDGTEKTFNGSTAIKSDTDSNKKNTKNVVIYDTVSLINSNAFQNCSSLTSVVIPDSVIYIGREAFDSCKSLTSIEIPDSVTSIGNYAFSNCSSLTSITIPSGVTIIGEGAFRGCSSLTSITIPDSVTSIGDSAFNGCKSLTNVVIPNSVTSIGDEYAFEGCSKLESVTIQNSTSKLGYGYDSFDRIASSAKLYVPSNLLADYQADSKWTGAFKGGIYAIQ